MLSLSSCSVFQRDEHYVKDSLFIWSDSFDESLEANKVVTDYQTIQSLEDSIPKSDVQMIFEAMVNNEIPEIDLSSDNNVDNEETLKQRNAKLKEYNAKLKEHNQKLRETIQSKKGLVAQNVDAAPVVNSELIVSSDTDSNPEVVSTEVVSSEVVSAEELASSEVNASPIKPSNPVVEDKQTEGKLPTVVASSELDVTSETSASTDVALSSVDDVNRLTQSNPTASGISVDKVLPPVNNDVVATALPQKILLLAEPNSNPNSMDYGMWQLTKNGDSQYQEVCTLSSSTIQIEDENYSTQVWINVVGNDLLVNSTTNLDIKKSNVGLSFDNGAVQKFNKNYFRTSAVWNGNLDSALQNNKQLKIRLGGNELGRRIQEVAISLKDLKRAYTEYRQCNQGTQIGSL